MIEYNNEKFYTCTEVAKMLNEEVPGEEWQAIKAKVKALYNKKDDYCYTDQFWQLRLYKAMHVNSIRYVTFLKNKNQRKCYAFAAADILKWLDTENAKHPFKASVSNVEIHEPVTGTNCIIA